MSPQLQDQLATARHDHDALLIRVARGDESVTREQFEASQWALTRAEIQADKAGERVLGEELATRERQDRQLARIEALSIEIRQRLDTTILVERQAAFKRAAEVYLDEVQRLAGEYNQLYNEVIRLESRPANLSAEPTRISSGGRDFVSPLMSAKTAIPAMLHHAFAARFPREHGFLDPGSR